MILQERIEELCSGILIMHGDKVELIGFLSPERLEDYYIKNKDCFHSHGFYKYEELDFGYIKDDSVFIVIGNNQEKCIYNFKLFKKDVVKYKDKNNKPLTKTYWIRKCSYNNIYNYRDMEISKLFNTIEELNSYFEDKYNKELDI